MALTKREMVELIFKHTDIMKQDCFQIVDSVFEIIKGKLEKGNKVTISGFGKWVVNSKSPRQGRNPSTGEPLMISGRRVVTFKCSPVLRKSFRTET